MPRKSAPQPATSDLETTTLPPARPDSGYRVLGEMTDKEVTEYAAFLFETVAHLQGRLGSLNTHNLLGLGARIRRIGAAHNMNVRIATNWAAGPREIGRDRVVVKGTTLEDTSGQG